IDGKGHQYHNGHEGTNASWAFARILSYDASPKQMSLTSDATDAYQLVNDDVQRVVRSVLFLKPEVFIILDSVSMNTSTPKVQARFQVFNDDKHGSVAATGSEFRIDRPGVSLLCRVQAANAFTVRTGKLALPEDLGIYPYAEVESSGAQAHQILTVCTVQQGDAPHGRLEITRDQSRWSVNGTHGPMRVAITIDASGEIPRFIL
ncbi:MAG TPA: hypothetical protein VK470_02015, partial [Bacteroidota bacterium]|nr:hypothetical protein [Bacteroidota bacterium]